MTEASRSVLRRYVLRSAIYEGSGGTAWFAGSERRAPSIAPFFCGDDARAGTQGQVWRRRIPDRIMEIADAGGLPILRIPETDTEFDDILPRAVTMPAMVDIHVALPTDVDALRAKLLTSTTREDFRRIRRANFTYRITSDPDEIREFHARHYTPLVADRFPEDGIIRSVQNMLRDLDRGGELVCAEIDGAWVAGIFNVSQETTYALQNLGIRDADDDVRQKRVVAALVVRSLERAVELGKDQASLGRSLPILGKGSVWFKAKWGGTLSRTHVPGDLYLFMDLRLAGVRRMLSESPIIHRLDGDDLAVSSWLEPGDEPLRVTTREAGRYPGISRWYVLALPETLETGAAQLSANERIVPVAVTPHGDQPHWLGEVLPDPDASARPAGRGSRPPEQSPVGNADQDAPL